MFKHYTALLTSPNDKKKFQPNQDETELNSTPSKNNKKRSFEEISNEEAKNNI